MGRAACVFVVSCSFLVACEGGSSTPRDGSVADTGMRPPSRDAGPTCEPRSASESACGDGFDDDCDGFIDCADPQCEAQACGDGLTCIAGGCLTPCADGDDGCLPPLGRIDNVRATVHGDNVLVEFSAVQGALDYRIYPNPESGKILVGSGGETVVRDAIYRCAGDRPRQRRDNDGLNLLGVSLTTPNLHGYSRTESESLLGYVYLTPDTGRQAVYRVANPSQRGGYAWEYGAPWGQEYNGADYVVGTAARDALLAQGWRDDGIAFYIADGGTRTVYRSEYTGDGTSLFYTAGPEQIARLADGSGQAPRFHVLTEQAPGSVGLYRIFYAGANMHDVLAAGEANRERVLYQGNVPITALHWPALRGRTTFVIEALDAGCPFPGGFVSAAASPAEIIGAVASNPRITLDDARLPSGEVFINGQHDTANRPRAIARAFVTVEPQARPTMDWYMGFDEALSPVTQRYADGNGFRILHNDRLSLEWAGAHEGGNWSYGTMLGEFSAGSNSSFSLIARGIEPRIASDRFLHVTMSADVASTLRRYPQIFITDTPLDPDFEHVDPFRVIMVQRLGLVPSETATPTGNHTIVAQVFGQEPELQVQFCDERGWGVSQQCPKANLYGYHAGNNIEEWDAPWLPNPMLGDLVGNDRPVRFDVYASTERVYVYIDGRPGGCAILPAGQMPSGRVNVMFGIAAYHIDIDDSVQHENSAHQYWHRRSLAHTDRRIDDLGIDMDATLPGWDESIMPCGDRYYANGL